MTQHLRQLPASLRAASEWPSVANYAQAARELRALNGQLPPVRMALLASFTADALIPILEVETAQVGRAAIVYVGPFNAVQQELLDPHSGCAAHQPDLVFVAQLLEDVCPPLAGNYLDLTPADVEQLIGDTISDLVAAVEIFRRHSQAAVVVHNFSLPRSPLLGIFESAVDESQTEAVRRLNRNLVSRLQALPGVHVLDFDRLCAEIGYREWRDEKLWYVGRAPLSERMLANLAQVQATFAQAIHGSPHKCLVLDLDNTLWGGVLGEEGVAGIKLGPTYPGNVFQDIQRAALRLHQRGVLLAINSKNNAVDVDEVLRAHPDMILRPEHFAATRINWRPKPENMLDIAHELNIGVDSLVFLDDNPAECALMREQLPEVLVLSAGDAAGTTDPLRVLRTLADCRAFDRLSYSDEDRRRGVVYQQQAGRQRLHQSAASLDEFLAGLQMTAEVQPVDEFTFPRIVELIHKTNQFNLTTRRHNAARLAELAADPSWGVFSLRVSDRFGDNGLVGVAIVRLQADVAEIDTLLLSCRVIGRTVETALLSFVADWARSKGVEWLQGWFLPTTKNAPAADFFAKHGFTRVSGDANGQESQWQLSLDQVPFHWPPYIQTSEQSAAAPDGQGRPSSARSSLSDDDRLLRTIALVLGVEWESLTDDASSKSIASWDSLNHLNLVMAIEAEFKHRFTPEEMLAMHNVGQIRQRLAQSASAADSQIAFADCRRDDVPALRAFIEKSYGAGYVLGVNDAYFQWQYQRTALSEGRDYHLRLAKVNGQIAGCLGYIPVELSIAGRVVRACWLTNWMVDPDQRHVGLGPVLVREVSRDFEVTLALGANEEARDILARMGWTDFGMLRRFVNVLDVAGAATLVEDGQFAWPIDARSTTPAVDTRANVQQVPRFSPDVTDLWDRVWGVRPRAAGTRRTAEFLNWRYSGHCQFPYRSFEVRERGRLAGFAVYRVEQVRDRAERVGRIVELVAERGYHPPLLAAVLDDARQHEAVAIDYFAGGTYDEKLLVSHGFLPGEHPAAARIPVLYQPLDRRRQGIRFLADLRNLPDAASVVEWYVSKADGDQDRPS